MIWIHAGLITLWVFLAYRYYSKREVTKAVLEDIYQLQKASEKWLEEAYKEREEAAKKLEECNTLQEEMRQYKERMERALKGLEE